MARHPRLRIDIQQTSLRGKVFVRCSRQESPTIDNKGDFVMGEYYTESGLRRLAMRLTKAADVLKNQRRV